MLLEQNQEAIERVAAVADGEDLELVGHDFHENRIARRAVAM